MSDYFSMTEGSDNFSFGSDTQDFNGASNVSVQAEAIAPIYSESGTYSVGDYVMREGKLYVCITAIPSSEAWNASHWESVRVINPVAYVTNTVFRSLDLNLADIRSSYVSTTIGGRIRFTSSTASYTYRRIIPVAKGMKYVVSETYGSTLASGNLRNSVICSRDGIVLQVLEATPIANSTVKTTFTAEQDGFLYWCIDVNYTGLAIKGYEAASDIVALQDTTTVMKGAMYPSALTDYILDQKCDNLLDMNNVAAANLHRIELYRNRITVTGNGNLNGTTYYSYLISSTPRYLATSSSTATIIGNLTADDFKQITLADNYDMYITRSYISKKLRSVSTLTGGFIVATRDSSTGTVTYVALTGQDPILNEQKAFGNTRNLCVDLPALRTNKNIAVIYQNRYPGYDEEYIVSFDVRPNYSGLFNEPICGTSENMGTASRAYAIGEYLIMHDTLYKVTSAIASGGTITVGTNVTATTVGAELTSLQAQINALS